MVLIIFLFPARDEDSDNFIREAIIISASLIAVFIIIITIYILVKRNINAKRKREKPSKDLCEGDVLLKHSRIELDIQMDLQTPDHVPPPAGF